MSRRLALMSLGVALSLVIGSATPAPSQPGGTVLWVTGYPKGYDVVPPATQGSFDVYGTYTVNNGYTLVGTNVTYYTAPSGAPALVATSSQGGDWGALNGVNQIIPKNVAFVSKGQYYVIPNAYFQDAMGNKTSILGAPGSVNIK